MFFRQVVDDQLAQYAYLIGCQRTGEAIVIDPERDVDRYVELAEAEGLRLTAVAETHIHADFVSGARELAERYGAHVYVSAEGGPDWQYVWPLADGISVTLLRDGDRFRVGNVEIEAVHTPGHTPEHLMFVVFDRGGGASEPMGLITGDFVFAGDLGRPDLLESAAGVVGMMRPSAHRLYESLQRVLAYPDYLQVWPGHGAGSACGKALGAVPVSTIGYERRHNPAIAAAASGAESFVDAMLEGQPEPPLYFARMKHVNKVGPDVLGTPRHLRPLAVEELAALSGNADVYVIDTRTSRRAFMDGHLPGAIHAPFSRSFPTIAGSYLEPGRPISLIAEAAEAKAAMTALIRIGLDDAEGFATPETLMQYGRSKAALASIERVSFPQLATRLAAQQVTVLDVRGGTEYAQGHVEGALNIAHTRLAARLDEVPRDRPVAVHCESGIRAASAASFLAREGLSVVLVDDAFANYRG